MEARRLLTVCPCLATTDSHDAFGPAAAASLSGNSGPKQLPRFDAAVPLQALGSDVQVNAYSVPEMADWNTDGLADLIVGEKTAAGQGKVRVYLNTGTPAEPVYAAPFYARTTSGELAVTAQGCLGVFPQVVDFNGDGDKDLLLGLADGRVEVRINENTDPDPRFGPAAYVQVGPPGSTSDVDVGARATVEVVDFNNDGRFDLVLGAYDGKVRLLANEGTDQPEFHSVTFLQDGSGDLVVPTGRSSVAVYDLDGDGGKDLVSGNTEGQVLFYANRGTDAAPAFTTGAMLEAAGVTIDLPGLPRSRPWIGDWNADGVADLLVGAYDGLVRLYAGRDASVPAPFEILGPAGGIDDPTPEVTWEASAGAVGYDVVISTAADLSAPVREFFDVPGTSVTVTDPLDEGTYYLGVTAIGPNLPPVVDAGPDQRIDEGSMLIGAGWFSDAPRHRQDATNNGLSFTLNITPKQFQAGGPRASTHPTSQTGKEAGNESWTATVDYGDETGPQPLELNPDKTFTLTHFYAADGLYTVTVTVTDDADGVGTDTLQVTVDPVPEVLDRHIFYNRSAFDGNDPAADLRDDEAVAPDKEALLPGETATFDNYTSYSRGVNGLMIDVDDLPEDVALDVDDFEFRTGNDNHAADWARVAAMPEITLRRGAGTDGSDRITITWPDNTIQKQWLQVTIFAGGDVGLPEPDVFYFGNAIGESGNSTTDAKVNAYDMLGARDNQRTFVNPAAIDFDYDYNRDARVNAYDMLIARDNQTHFLNDLELITAAGRKAAGQPTAQVADGAARDAVFKRAVGRDSGRRGVSSSKLDWLYEWDQLDQIGTRRQPSRGHNPVDEARDTLLVR